MAKKQFKTENPAMAFISPPVEAKEETKKQPPKTKKTKEAHNTQSAQNKQPAQNTQAVSAEYYTDYVRIPYEAQNTQLEHYVDYTHKTYNTDDVLNTVNTQSEHNTDNVVSVQDVHNKDNTPAAPVAQHEKTRQIKSKRVNLLIYPGLHEALSKIAYVQRTSLNDLICKVMGEYANDHAGDIQKYDDFVG